MVLDMTHEEREAAVQKFLALVARIEFRSYAELVALMAAQRAEGKKEPPGDCPAVKV